MRAVNLKEYLSEMKLEWDKVEPRAPAKVTTCSWCDRDILDNEHYYKMARIRTGAGTQVFQFKTGEPDRACTTCAKSVGLEW